MQYLQKFIQKDHGFGYTLDEPVPSYDHAEVWALHRGKSKENGDPCLVFYFDPSKANAASLQSKQNLAKTNVMRLKTLRHPDVLKYVSSVEASDGTVYVATEPATPLATVLANSPGKLDRETVQWGLFTVSRALGFMHTSGLIHGRVNSATVFVTPNGDWKLGGLECVTQHAAAASLSQHAATLQRDAYQSPEFARGNWSAVTANAASAVDSWALGCLMYEAHAGSLTSPDQLQNLSSLPKPLVSAYQKLLASNASARAPAGQLPNHPYFHNSKYVELNMFVENLALKGQLEREAFLGKLPSIMDRLPDGFCTFKILPMLSQSIETGTGGSAAFACIVKMKSRLSEEDFTNNVVKKYATAWYGNQNMDRNLRVELYGQMDLFVKHFDDGTLNTVVFPAMCASFQDMQAPALRDASVKAVLTICGKLTDKNLNSVLMSHFARLQVDPEPAIRTNTTVCLGKLASKLSQSARNKVLAAAFLRSLKDPFPHARAAGINAILITTEMYSIKDIAARLLPAIVPLLIDGSGDVRKLAFKVTADFQQRLVKNHEEMARAEETGADQQPLKNEVSGPRGSSTSSGGWGLGSFSSMTAALLSNKTETTPSQASSTGISSEDFKKGRPASGTKSDSFVKANGGSSTPTTAAKPPKTNSDSWSNVNGSGGSATAPAAFSSTPLTADTGLRTSSDFFFEPVSERGDQPPNEDEDEDEDGWGDMDVKPSDEPQAVNEEDLFVAMMGNPSSHPKPVPGGLSRSASNASSASGSKASGGDLWDLAPPLVSKPKSRAPTTRPATSGMGLGAASARRNKKSTGDDWEALLGGTGGSRTRRTTGKPSGR